MMVAYVCKEHGWILDTYPGCQVRCGSNPTGKRACGKIGKEVKTPDTLKDCPSLRDPEASS